MQQRAVREGLEGNATVIIGKAIEFKVIQYPVSFGNFWQPYVFLVFLLRNCDIVS